MKEIRVWPHPALTTPCKEAEMGPFLDTLIEELVDTIERTPRAAGLAAPQIGSTIRVFAMKRRQGDEPLVLINPQGRKVDSVAWEDGWEECLSFPGFKAQVRRPTKIVLAYQVILGGVLIPREIALQGFEARVAAHEMDHLDGRTIIDYMPRNMKRAVERKMLLKPPKRPPTLINPASKYIGD